MKLKISIIIIFIVALTNAFCANAKIMKSDDLRKLIETSKQDNREIAYGMGTINKELFPQTEQMQNLGMFLGNSPLHREEQVINGKLNLPSQQLIQQFQHYRDSLQLEHLQIDERLVKTACFHNWEMIDFDYRSVDFEKDGFPYQGLLFYSVICMDYNIKSYIFSASSMEELLQQCSRQDSLLQYLRNPSTNQLGLYVTQYNQKYLCTIYLSQRFLTLTEKQSCGGSFGGSVGARGITSLPYFVIRVYNASFTPKNCPCEIDTSNLVYSQKVTPELDSTFAFSLPYPNGPKRAIFFYDLQEQPVAMEWFESKEYYEGYYEKVDGEYRLLKEFNGYNLPKRRIAPCPRPSHCFGTHLGQIQKKYYIDEDGTKHYFDEEE